MQPQSERSLPDPMNGVNDLEDAFQATVKRIHDAALTYDERAMLFSELAYRVWQPGMAEQNVTIVNEALDKMDGWKVKEL